MRAVAVATAVIEHLDGQATSAWRVRGVTGSTLYLARGGFVIALTGPGVPLMPNGIAVDRRPAGWPSVATDVWLAAGSLELGDESVQWSAADPPTWDPAPGATAWSNRQALRKRAEAILRGCGVRPHPDPSVLTAAFARLGLSVACDPDGRHAVTGLLAAVGGRDPAAAATAAELLLGRGPGLTPEGDDLLCGAAATFARCAGAAGVPDQTTAAWLRALVPPDAQRRSSELSITLLELATAGEVAQPADRLLDPQEVHWRAWLRTLLRVGSSTGPAYALAIGTTALLLSEAPPPTGSLR